MRQLTKTQTAIFLVGGLLMVIGAGTSLLAWPWAPWLFAAGALGFAPMQMLQRYEGRNFTIRRLRRIMLISDVLFLVAALLMFDVDRKWVVILLIAAILQLYSMHRISYELEKEEKKTIKTN